MNGPWRHQLPHLVDSALMLTGQPNFRRPGMLPSSRRSFFLVMSAIWQPCGSPPLLLGVADSTALPQTFQESCSRRVAGLP